MFLNFIQFAGVKNRAGSYPLTRKVVIGGPNFSGKSTIVEAVRLVLLGRLPELGEQNQDTFDMCGGEHMTVEARTDNALTFSRSWRPGRAGIEQVKHLPDGVSLNIPLLNADEYFGLTDTQAIDYIFSRVAMPAGYTISRVHAKLDEILAESDDTTPDDEAAVKQVKAWADDTIAKAHSFAFGLLQFTDPKKGRLASEYTLKNREKKDSAGAVSTLNELEKEAWRWDQAAVDKIRAEQAEKQRQLMEAREERGGLNAKQNHEDQKLRRLNEIGGQINELEEDPTPTIERLERERADFAKRLHPVTEKTATDLESQIASVKAKLETEVKYKTDLESDIAKRTAELAEIESLETCPTCKCTGAAFKKLRKNVTDSIAADLAKAKEILATKDERMSGLRRSLELDVPELRAVRSKLDANAEVENEIQSIDDELTEIRRTQETKAIRLEELRAEEHKLDGEETGADPDRLRAIDVELDELEAQLEEIQRREAEAVRQQAAHNQAKAAKAKYDRAAAFVTALDAAKDKMKALQSEMIEKVMGDVCERANMIAGEILPSPIEFHRGEIGRMSGPSFIKHRTFSGTEKALTYLAFSAAISSSSSLRLLILDEMGRLTPAMQGKAMSCFAKAVNGGLLDQVICVTPRDKALPEIEGWTVINLQ